MLQGSLAELEQRVRQSGIGFDVITANILLDVLRDLLAGGLAETLAPDGLLILSGILEDQQDDLLEAARGAGLALLESRAETDWRTLIVKREPPPK